MLLKKEIKSRAATLGDIQNKITESLLYVYQGAKLGGEVSKMKKENNRISEKLQTGLDQVTKLQQEADKKPEKLSEKFSLS